ncbi:MAG: methyltransferase [Alphaproteobacteria bacterium]|nr:MAG: methyltransferase [Alphaproteobacteria bacterium]
MLGLSAQWIQWRNALLSNPKFQRFAADFPLTRGIAHRRTDALFDLVAGFVYSQVLHACIALDVFKTLQRGPLDVAALAAASNVPAPAMARLLSAAAALDLVEPVGDRFALGPQGAALLGNAGLADMIRHHDRLYADLLDPVALLRRGRGEHLSNYWPYATSGEPGASGDGAVSDYSALMAATQPSVAADVLDAYSLRRHRVVMDVGGGEGAFLAAVGARWPHIALSLFDLPAVVARARNNVPKASFYEGDFLSDPLPPGADLITLVRILHDHDDDGVAKILASAYAALAPGGKLLIAEPMSAAPRKDRVAEAYFGLYLLAMGRGQARTPRLLKTWLRRAGFRGVRMLRVRTPSLLQVLIADA